MNYNYFFLTSDLYKMSLENHRRTLQVCQINLRWLVEHVPLVPKHSKLFPPSSHYTWASFLSLKVLNNLPFCQKMLRGETPPKKFVLQYLSHLHLFFNYTHGWLLLSLSNSFPMTFMSSNLAKCGKKFFNSVNCFRHWCAER